MRWLMTCLAAGAVLSVALVGAREDDVPMPASGQTWVELGGVTYGARPDEQGPIGGGVGYAHVVTDGTYRVKTIDELLDALGKAQAGDVIYIDPAAEMDFTGLVYAEKLVLGLSGGVTLASNRGQDGAPGALLYSDAFQTAPLLKTLDPDCRVTGLRLRGPDPKTRLDHHQRAFGTGRADASGYYYALPNSNGIQADHPNLEVDNCELSGWSHAAVYLTTGSGHHVHHNYIHHNQRNGLGYGVSHGYGDECVSLIEFNVFDYNRHSIAGTGKPGNAYEASNNVEGGHAISHHFDMHGGGDRDDGTNIAGDWRRVRHNTFQGATQRAVVIRGVPQEKAQIHHNWFAAPQPGPAVIGPWPLPGRTHVVVEENAYGTVSPAVEVRGG
jgi:hypothetical protein